MSGLTLFFSLSISPQVLEACSKCLECLCNEEFAIAGRCEVSKKTLIDALVIKLKQAVQDFFTEVNIGFVMQIEHKLLYREKDHIFIVSIIRKGERGGGGC